MIRIFRTDRSAVSRLHSARWLCLTAALLAAPASSARGQTPVTVTTSSSLTSTVLASGPRTGTAGTNFFNIQGVDSGNFASFGVADFTIAAPSMQAGSVSSISIALTESNANFTRAGTLSFFVTTDTTTGIAAGASPLVYQAPPGASPPGVGTQLGQSGTGLFSLGTGTFNTTGNVNSGTVNTYTFAPSSAAEAYLRQQLNAGGPIRIVITETADATGAAVAATFAGSSNSNLATRPMLTLTFVPVPEPATVLAVGTLGLAAVGALRRRWSIMA